MVLKAALAPLASSPDEMEFRFVASSLDVFAASTLTPKQIRRTSLVIFLVGVALMVGILLFGAEVKGAKRWLQLGSFSLQPSEFVKPAFIVLTAWLFNESQKRKDILIVGVARGKPARQGGGP